MIELKDIGFKYNKLSEKKGEHFELKNISLKIEKGYTGEESKAIMCMIPRRKVYDMCQMIQETDPMAFWTISEVNEVHGRGFSFERRV